MVEWTEHGLWSRKSLNPSTVLEVDCCKVGNITALHLDKINEIT